MSHKIYIYARASDWSGSVERIVDELYFGPFEENEEYARVNDRYADLLEADGFDVYSIAMFDDDATKYNINPREFWMAQLANLQEFCNV